jgi:hypothetical protein
MACLLGSCGESTYERLSVLGGSTDAQIGAIKVFGDASVAPTGETGGSGAGTGTGTGGSSLVPDPGLGGAGEATSAPGSGGDVNAPDPSGTGGSSVSSTVDSGSPASGGSGTGGMRSGSGGATSTGGVAPGSGGAGTGGAQSGGATVVSSGGVTGSGGAGTGGATVPADPAHYNFEASIQGWGIATGTEPFTSIVRSTTQHFAGTASLAGTLSAFAGRNYFLEVAPPVPAIPVNATVTFHVFVPAAAQLTTLRAYVLSDAFVLTSTDAPGASLKRDAWTTMTLTVPPSATSVIRLGVKLISSGIWTGTVYVDSIDW